MVPLVLRSERALRGGRGTTRTPLDRLPLQEIKQIGAAGVVRSRPTTAPF